MNNNLKPTLWAVFAALVMMIWMKWEYANAPQPPAPVASTAQVQQDGTASTATTGSGAIPGGETPKKSAGRLVHVKTDVLDLVISTHGGTIVESQLLKYSVSLEDKTPIKLFSSESGKLFHFETGLLSKNAKAPSHEAEFISEKTEYVLEGDSVTVPLTWQADGVTVTKAFTFYRGRYDFSVEQRVDNHGTQTWQGQQYRQLRQDPVIVKSGLTTFNTFAGAAYSTPEMPYDKVSYSELADTPLHLADVEGGWVGFMQHYFMGAIIPPQNEKDTFYSGKAGNRYRIGLTGKLKNVSAGASMTFATTGFVGPKIKDDLARIAPNLDKATDYGWLFFLSEMLFNVLAWVNSILGNWGWSIVIVTIGIKTLLFPLAAKSFKSMAKMRKFQPEMERIRENYGEDRQLVGKKMMELYKKEGINPASGCLPILIQIPIFLAFYYMLMESVELRQAPWFLWVNDLSIRDPFYVLPVLNMGLMFLQQRLNPPPSDPMQRKVLMFMPLVFGLLFLVFPAGLVLYWAVSNSFSIIQQYVITKRYGGLAHPLSHEEDKHYHPKE